MFCTSFFFDAVKTNVVDVNTNLIANLKLKALLKTYLVMHTNMCQHISIRCILSIRKCAPLYYISSYFQDFRPKNMAIHYTLKICKAYWEGGTSL